MSEKQISKIDLSEQEQPWYEKNSISQKYPRYSTPQVPSYGGFCDLINSQRRGSLKTEMLPQPQKELSTNSNSSSEDSPLLHIMPNNMLGFSFLSMLEKNESKKINHDEELMHPPIFFNFDPNTVPEAMEKLEESPYVCNNQELPNFENISNDHDGDMIRRKDRRAVTEVYENPNVHLQYKRIKYRKNRNYEDRLKQTESVGDIKMAFERERMDIDNLSPTKISQMNNNNF